MRFQCPACKKTHQVVDSLAGKQIACDCGNRLVVPAAPSQPPAGPPVQSPANRPAQTPAQPSVPPPSAAAPAASGGRASLVLASLLMGFILGVVVGGAGYALLIAPKNSPQQTTVVAEHKTETPSPANPSESQPGEPEEEPATSTHLGTTATANSEIPSPLVPAGAEPSSVKPALERPPRDRQLRRDEIVTWGEKVDKELKILEVSQPGALRLLESKPEAVHVVRISDECTADKFNSDESQLLNDWVAGGGIMWAKNDVFSLFDVRFKGVYGRVECTPSVTPDLCPILTGVERVTVLMVSFEKKGNLAHERVVPLLKGKLALTTSETCIWSLVPYGKGWLSDVKQVDETKYDGARFWLNFRMFCLGWDIPGAVVPTDEFCRSSVTVLKSTPPQTALTGGGDKTGLLPSPPPGQQATIITTSEQLSEALSDAGQKALWVQLEKENAGDATVEKLKTWVEQGGVLWIDTDLSEKFEFPLYKLSADKVPGQAMVAKVTHDILNGLEPGQNVGFKLAPGDNVVAGTWTELNQEMMPILGWPVGRNRLFACCVLRPLGQGTVIFRPREINTDSEAGRVLEKNLLKYSFR